MSRLALLVGDVVEAVRHFRRPSEVQFMEEIIERRIATGVSSRAMAYAVLGLTPRHGYDADPARNMPYDGGDWGRCVDTYLSAPKHLQRKMRPIMADYYQRLLAYDARCKTEPHAHPDQSWRLRGVQWPL